MQRPVSFPTKTKRDSARDVLEKASEGFGVSPGVAQQIVLDAEGVNPLGRKLSGQEIEAKWGVGREKIAALKESCGGDFSAVRQHLGNRMMMMLAVAQDDLFGDLMNPLVMAGQSPEQKARVVKALTDSTITVLDGIGGKDGASTGDVREMMRRIAEERAENAAKMEEMKKANARTVED